MLFRVKPKEFAKHKQSVVSFFKVKKIRFKPDEFVDEQLFCTGDDVYLLADANGDGM